uniref:Uncharacterized protein n=1 Tax=Arundo donax TaxID=35708 RepID=A0A0A8Y8T6_ARUDO
MTSPAASCVQAK